MGHAAPGVWRLDHHEQYVLTQLRSASIDDTKRKPDRVLHIWALDACRIEHLYPNPNPGGQLRLPAHRSLHHKLRPLVGMVAYGSQRMRGAMRCATKRRYAGKPDRQLPRGPDHFGRIFDLHPKPRAFEHLLMPLADRRLHQQPGYIYRVAAQRLIGMRRATMHGATPRDRRSRWHAGDAEPRLPRRSTGHIRPDPNRYRTSDGYVFVRSAHQPGVDQLHSVGRPGADLRTLDGNQQHMPFDDLRGACGSIDAGKPDDGMPGGQGYFRGRYQLHAKPREDRYLFLPNALGPLYAKPGNLYPLDAACSDDLQNTVHSACATNPMGAHFRHGLPGWNLGNEELPDTAATRWNLRGAMGPCGLWWMV